MDKATAGVAKPGTQRKVYSCVVTSDKMQKSRVAVIDRKVKHAGYKKYINRRTKLMFHDEQNETKIGDVVEVIQTRPLSANKSFILARIIKKAEGVVTV